jgi:hypothetical protein
MAEVRSNPIVEGLSGKLGDQLVFRHLRDGRTILCAKPDFSKRKLSMKQKAHHAKFKAGSAYARDAAQRQPIYAELAAGTMKNAYNIALADWFHAPQIRRVDFKDGVVRIHATHNVRVAGVKVAVLSGEGLVVEQGEAVQVDELWWSYAPQMPWEGKLKLGVEARDLAGNVTKEEKMFG